MQGALADSFLESSPELEDASFARLRTKNEAPLDSEIPLIRGIISKGEARLYILEAEVYNLEAALAELLKKRDDAAERLREHRAILHPVRRTPPELICEIFALTLDRPDGREVGHTPPWYLGQVCQSWRRWALAYPRLWSHITIPSSPTPSKNRAAFEALLLRSSSAPLNIYWTALMDQYDEYQRPVDHELADLALAHCRRWATLRLDVRISSAADSLDWLHPAREHLTSLRTIDVISSGNAVPIPDVFSVAPSLNQVLLTDWELAYFSPRIQIPWDQITHYRGAFPELSQLDILRTAPKLVQCAISFETSDVDAVIPDESQPVVLYQLRRLNIEKPHFLYHLAAPLLEELYCMYAYEEELPALLPFVHRSRCLLQKLVLVSCRISPTLFDALRGLPSLTYLLIEAAGTAEEEMNLLRELKIAGTSRDICPHLTSFVYGSCSGGGNFHEAFIDMARSRLRRLAYVRVFDPQSGSLVRGLRDEGLDAVLITETEFSHLRGKGFF
ncbi:hypothetical protein C8R47DRAFT_113014 [Mycena vitilis]|nr:hypothetical protein C8R47DRAFT_113014 [Mycena vitilis]